MSNIVCVHINQLIERINKRIFYEKNRFKLLETNTILNDIVEQFRNTIKYIKQTEEEITRLNNENARLNYDLVKIQIELIEYGAHIDKFYFCPYHKDATNLKYKKDSSYRKPNTGMLEKIIVEWNLDKKNLYFIGDSDTDMECAKNFKISGYKYNGTDNLMKIYDNVFVNY